MQIKFFIYLFIYSVDNSQGLWKNRNTQIFLEKREMKTYQIIYSSLTAVDR